MILGARVVQRQPDRLFLLLLFRIVGSEIIRDALPRFTFIGRAKQKLRADVDDFLVGRAQPQGGVPVEAILGLALFRKRLDPLHLAGRFVKPQDVAALELAVHDVLV